MSEAPALLLSTEVLWAFQHCDTSGRSTRGCKRARTWKGGWRRRKVVLLEEASARSLGMLSGFEEAQQCHSLQVELGATAGATSSALGADG
eukprot:1529485-Rhodomonas_salina.3